MQKRPIPLRRPNLKLFSGDELRVIDQVIDAHRGESAATVSQRSHELPTWRTPSKANASPTAPHGLSILSRARKNVSVPMRWQYVSVARSMELGGVTEDEEFTRQAQIIIPGLILRDEVLSSAYNLLAMFPASGRSLGNGIRRLVYDVVPVRVTVVILYTVEADGVTLRDIFEHP